MIVGLKAEAVAPAVPAAGATDGTGWFAVAVETADPVTGETLALELFAAAVVLA